MKPFWYNKNVLITGANGFIGSSLVNELVSRSANVSCLVNKLISSCKFVNLSNTKIYVGDVVDCDLVRSIISNDEIEFVFHLAANAIVKSSAKDPVNTYNTNIMGTVSVLEAARSVGSCNRILVTSSDKAYGEHKVLPYTEDLPLIPKNTYDTSKACADMIAGAYANNYNMPIIVTRCCNVYGPGDTNYSRLIPSTIKRLLNDEQPILYAGSVDAKRQFVYINDVVDAFLMLCETKNFHNGESFNIGGLTIHSSEEIIKIVSSLMNSEIKPLLCEKDKTFKEIYEQYMDYSKIQSKIGWVPQIEIKKGLMLTIKWYMER